MRRTACFLLAGVGVGLLAGGAGRSAAPAPLVALTTSGVARVQPVTLRPVGRPLRLGFNWFANARSPAGTRLAIASNSAGLVRLVDLKRMRAIHDLRFRGIPWALYWLEPRLLVVELSTGRVLGVDPITRHIRWRRSIAGSIEVVRSTGDGVVLLVAPEEEIGPTTLVSITAGGVLRSVLLERVLSGSRQVSEDGSDFDIREPGLAVDAAGNRAFVIGEGEPVAEVDLGAMTVTYHGGSRFPAKSADGPSRDASWLGNGLVAVTGSDGHRWTDAQGREQSSIRPAGLSLLDTRSWTSRQVDSSTSSVVVAGGLLLASGWGYDSTSPMEAAGTGLTAYTLEGARRFRLLSGTIAGVQSVGELAYVWYPGSPDTPGRIAAIDLASGRIVSTAPMSGILQLVS